MHNWKQLACSSVISRQHLPRINSNHSSKLNWSIHQTKWWTTMPLYSFRTIAALINKTVECLVKLPPSGKVNHHRVKARLLWRKPRPSSIKFRHSNRHSRKHSNSSKHHSSSNNQVWNEKSRFPSNRKRMTRKRELAGMIHSPYLHRKNSKKMPWREVKLQWVREITSTSIVTYRKRLHRINNKVHRVNSSLGKYISRQQLLRKVYSLRIVQTSS